MFQYVTEPLNNRSEICSQGLLTKDAVVADLGRHTKKYAHLAKPPAAPDASVDGGDTVDWSIGDDDRMWIP